MSSGRCVEMNAIKSTSLNCVCGICGVTGGGSSSSGTSILNMSHRVKAFIFLFFSLENR